MEIRPHSIQLATSSLAYGGGLLIGNIVSFLLFEQVPPNWFICDNPAVRLTAGVMLAFFISGLAGLLVGYRRLDASFYWRREKSLGLCLAQWHYLWRRVWAAAVSGHFEHIAAGLL